MQSGAEAGEGWCVLVLIVSLRPVLYSCPLADAKGQSVYHVEMYEYMNKIAPSGMPRVMIKRFGTFPYSFWQDVFSYTRIAKYFL